MYRLLDAECIIATIEQLERRIGERFPGSGLSKVAHEFVAIARDAAHESTELAKPHQGLRFLVGLVVVLGAFVFVYVGTFLNFSRLDVEASNLVQVLEAAINTAVLGGLGIAFLVKAEDKLKRKRALTSLHSLRAVIRVIDMHQLTKDPSVILNVEHRTASSPQRNMDAFSLGRYLDYCSELLSLRAKVAALYVQSFRDPVVIEAVNDVEMLSTNLSRKIWQKITMLPRYASSEAAG